MNKSLYIAIQLYNYTYVKSYIYDRLISNVANSALLSVERRCLVTDAQCFIMPGQTGSDEERKRFLFLICSLHDFT